MARRGWPIDPTKSTKELKLRRPTRESMISAEVRERSWYRLFGSVFWEFQVRPCLEFFDPRAWCVWSNDLLSGGFVLNRSANWIVNASWWTMCTQKLYRDSWLPVSAYFKLVRSSLLYQHAWPTLDSQFSQPKIASPIKISFFVL